MLNEHKIWCFFISFFLATFIICIPFTLCGYSFQNDFPTIKVAPDLASIDQSAAIYDKWVNQWVNTYFNTTEQLLDDNDLCALAAFIYCTYQRSHATLAVQISALKAQQQMAHGWQNVLTTRRNPSKKMPYSINIHQAITHTYHFWNTYQTYTQAAQTYDELAEYLLKTDCLSTDAQHALAFLKHNARIIIVQALGNIEHHVSTLFAHLLASEKRIPASIHTFIQNIQSLLASHGLISFAQADNVNTQLSAHMYDALCKTHEVGNYTWCTIEQARSQFYYEHYNALMKYMDTLGIPHKKRVFYYLGKKIKLPVNLKAYT